MWGCQTQSCALQSAQQAKTQMQVQGIKLLEVRNQQLHQHKTPNLVSAGTTAA
jgi:hypothetical protein